MIGCRLIKQHIVVSACKKWTQTLFQNSVTENLHNLVNKMAAHIGSNSRSCKKKQQECDFQSSLITSSSNRRVETSQIQSTDTNLVNKNWIIIMCSVCHVDYFLIHLFVSLFYYEFNYLFYVQICFTHICFICSKTNCFHRLTKLHCIVVILRVIKWSHRYTQSSFMALNHAKKKNIWTEWRGFVFMCNYKWNRNNCSQMF